MNRTLLCLLLCAGLGWAEPSPRLVVPVPHSHAVCVLKESPDGRYLATGDLSGAIKVWDASSQQLQQTISSQRGGFLPLWMDWLGSDRLVCYGNDFRFHLYDVHGGQQLGSQPEKPYRASGGVVQAGGRIFFSPMQAGSPLLQKWDPVHWKQEGSWPIPTAQPADSVVSLCINRQGTRVCLTLESGSAVEMSLPDGKVNWQLDHLPEKFVLQDYGPDGETVLATGAQGLYLGGAGPLRGPFAHPPDHQAFWVGQQVQFLSQKKAMEWDPAHPESDRALASKTVPESFGEGIFNHQLVVSNFQGDLLQASSGEEALAHPPFCGIRQLAYDRQGKIYAGLVSGQVVCWSLRSGTRETLFAGAGKAPVVGMVLSGNGKLLLVSRAGQSQVDIYDTERLQLKTSLPTRAAGLLQLHSSEDGRYVAGVRDSKWEVYDLKTGSLLQQRTFAGPVALAGQGAPKLALAESGQVVETNLADGKTTTYPNYSLDALEYDAQGRLFGLQQLAPGRLRFEPIVQRQPTELMAAPAGFKDYRFDSRTRRLRLSYDAPNWLMVGDQGQVFQLANQETPRPLLPDAGNWSSGPLLSLANGTFVSVGREQTLEFWKPGETSPCGQLLVLNQGSDWLVTDRSGLFDGTPEAERHVEWLVDDRKVRVDQIFEKAYRPGLLKSFTAASRAGSQAPVAGLQIQPPQVTIQSPAPGAEIAQRIVEVRIRVQDQGGGAGEPRLFVNGKGVPQAIRREGDDYCLQAPLQAGVNELRCTALDRSGTVESRGDRLRVTCTAIPSRGPKLLVVAVGVNQAGNAPKLSFAEKDAQSLSEKLQSPLFESSEVRLLTGEKARIDSLRQTFEALGKEAQPQDTLVIFLAGHGLLDSNGYHFLMGSGQPALDGPELTKWLREFPAQRQFVILDTCHAGAVSDELAASFAVNQQRMARGSGVYLLAACRSEQSALELPRLQHGLLTYSLLEGLQSAPPNSRQQVTVSGLIYFVCSQVPDLCHQVGLNQDVFQFVSGTDFPIRLRGKH